MYEKAFEIIPEPAYRSGRQVFYKGGIYEPMFDDITDDLIEPVLVLAHRGIKEVLLVSLQQGFPMMEFYRVNHAQAPSENLINFAQAATARRKKRRGE